MSIFSDKIAEAQHLMDKGNFRNAFSHIADVTVGRPDQLFKKIALMTDAGVALRDGSMLEYGLYLLEHNARDILAVPTFAPFHWFNLGNLRSNLLAVRESEGAGRSLYDRSLTAPAREAYSKAAASTQNNVLKSSILSAHGRLLMGLGRDVEAFSLFHEATQLHPNEVESSLGRIEALIGLAGTAPALENALLREAAGELEQWKMEVGSVGNAIEKLRQSIFDRLGPGNHEEPDYPRNSIITHSEREHTLVMQSLKNRLYLSPCASCLLCDRAIGDAAVLGANHAVVGGRVADRYRHTALLVGRISERYRALRIALVEHLRSENIPDGSNKHPHIPEVDGWKPIHSSTASLISIFSGAGTLLEGMAACVALYLGREVSGPVSIDHIMGTSKAPSAALKEVMNPAIHGFWDLWADGFDAMIPGVDDINCLRESLSSKKVEELSLDANRLTEGALSYAEWLRMLIVYLIRTADRDARGEVEYPPLWPLRPFILPLI